jgi:tetratricopeptide (TPR) repeat protein
LNKQIVTLINNRSAMYEKGSFPELAVDDCNKILEVYDRFHVKARQRKLRILETNFKQYYDALVEVCSLQLLYMQQNRDQLRMGLPASSPPPVPQSKLEELITKLVPEQMEQYETDKGTSGGAVEENNKPLPSNYTLLQLLKSFTGYNAWMSQAAKDGPTNAMETKLAALPETALADRASILLRQGRRYVFDGNYDKARQTLLKAYNMVKGHPEVYNIMEGDDFARLLEWTGMVKHWTYDLDGALSCYEACADLEPLNVSCG